MKLKHTNLRIGLGAAAVIAMLFVCTSCRQSNYVSYNIGKEADNFNVVRKLTAFNTRTDKIVFELTGTFSLSNTDNNELTVICETAEGEYKKHFIYLNDWMSYVVEDISGADVDKYSYEMNWMPQAIPGVSVTTSD